MSRTVNLKALLILGLTALGLGASVHVVHGVQVRRSAQEFLERAALAQADGRPAAALEALAGYLKLQPEDRAARIQFGLLLAAQAQTARQRQEACTLLERELKADPHNREARRAWAGLAVELGRYAEAKVELAAVAQETAQDADSLILLGRCEEGLQNYPSAVAYYAEAARHAPKRLECYARRVRLLEEKLGKPENATNVIQAMVQENPRSAAARVEAAEHFSRKGLWDEADAHVQAALAHAVEGGPSLYAWAAETALGKGDAELALNRLRSGLERHASDAGLRLNLARLELQLGRPAAALQTIAPLLSSFPNQTDDLVRLTGLLIDLDEIEKAAAAIEQLKGRAAPAIVGFLRAHVLAKRDEWGQARLVLHDVISSLSSTDWRHQAYLLLARCHNNQGNTDAELAAYNSALEVNRHSVLACRGKGDVLLRLGRLDDAINVYRLIVPRTPELTAPFVRLLIIRNLRLPPGHRDWHEADAAMARVPQRLRDSTPFLIVRGELVSAQDRPAEARSILEDARRQSPESLDVWLALAEHSESQSRHAEAVSLLAQAAEKFPGRGELILARLRFASRRGVAELRQELATAEKECERLARSEQSRVLGALGIAWYQLNDIPSAVRLWKQVAGQSARNLSVRMALFVAAAQLGEDAEMNRLLEEIRQVEGQEGACVAYGEATQQWLRAQRGDAGAWAKAARLAAAAAAQRPSWSAAVLLQAQIADHWGKTDEALQRYVRAMALGERRPHVIRRTVELLHLQRRYAEAYQILQDLSDSAIVELDMGRQAVALTLLAGTNNQASRKRALELARRVIPADTNEYQDLVWLGQVAAAAGQPAEAEKLFRRAIASDPTAPLAWAALLTMVVRTEPARSADIMPEVRRNLPPDRAARVLAPAYEMLNRPQEAQKEYEMALASAPADPDALGTAAVFYGRTRQLPKAEECLRKILELPDSSGDRGHSWARRHLAAVLAQAGTYSQYQSALALLARNQPATPDDERALGLVLATQPGRREQAIALLEKCHRDKALPVHEEFLLAQLHAANGNSNKALEHLTRVASVEHADPQHVASLIELLLKHDYPGAAQGWLLKLEEMKADAFLIASLHAQWLAKTGRPDAAVQRLTSLAQERPESLVPAAALLEKLRRPVDAESLYRSAIARDDTKGLLELARFLGRQGRTDEALECCARLRGRVPAEVVAEASLGVFRATPPTPLQYQRVSEWLTADSGQYSASAPLAALRAELEFHAQHYGEAIAAYRQVLHIEPNHPVALNMLAWLLAVKEGQAGEALPLIQRAIELLGPRSDLLDTRALVYSALNQPSAAAADLEEVVRMDPSATVYFHVALIHHRVSDRAQAQTAFRKAQELGLCASAVHPLERPAFHRLAAALTE
jgi:tetratricopeptide (TPR) repeat protein